MLEVVNHPVCVYPSKLLLKIAKERNWLSFNSLDEFYKQLKTGKIFAQHSWYEHYKQKYPRIVMDKAMFGKVLTTS